MSPAPGVLRPGLPQPWQGFLTYLLTLLTHWQGRNDICTGRVCLSSRRDLSEAGREAVSLAVWASEGLCQQGQGCIHISFSELPGEAAERPQTCEGPAGSLPRRARCLEGGGEAGPKSQPTAERESGSLLQAQPVHSSPGSQHRLEEGLPICLRPRPVTWSCFPVPCRARQARPAYAPPPTLGTPHSDLALPWTCGWSPVGGRGPAKGQANAQGSRSL